MPLRNIVPIQRRPHPAEAGEREPHRQHEGPDGARHDRGGRERTAGSPPGGSVVEYTGGSTGVSLALVCAVKGYPLHIVTSDAFAREKLDHMRILGRDAPHRAERRAGA